MNLSRNRIDLLIALALLAPLVVAYALTYPGGYWSDGRLLLALVSEGHWIYYHIVYLPAARLFSSALSWILGAGPKKSMLVLSSVSAAAGCSLFYLALRKAKLNRELCIYGVLLLATTPVVWFYATNIEVHALQLPFTSVALLWLVINRNDPERRVSFLESGLVLIGLSAAHLSGTLWGPALAVYALLRQKGRVSRRELLTVVALFAVVVAGWLYLVRDWPQGLHWSGLALERLLNVEWNIELLWQEMIEPGGVVYFVACGLLAAFLIRSPRIFSDPLVTTFVVLFATFLPFALTFGISERGAYYISLIPVACFSSCIAIRRLPPVVTRSCCSLLIMTNCVLTVEYVSWAKHCPTWIQDLTGDVENNAVVFTYSQPESICITAQTEVHAFSMPFLLSLQQIDALVNGLHVLDADPLKDSRIGVTRSLMQSSDPEHQKFVEALRNRFGDPARGHRAAYYLFDRRE